MIRVYDNPRRFARYFSESEFNCPCSYHTHRARRHSPQPGVHTSLVHGLDLLRERWGSPLIVSSGRRCPEHNKAIGGAPESSHITGRAADLVPTKGNAHALAEMALESGMFRQVIEYERHVHLAI